MRKIIYVIGLLVLLFVAAGFWVYGTIAPCGMLAQEFRKDIKVEFEEGEQITDEDRRKADRLVDDAVVGAIEKYSQLQCIDKLLAFWFFEDPYQQ